MLYGRESSSRVVAAVVQVVAGAEPDDVGVLTLDDEGGYTSLSFEHLIT